MIKKIFLLAVAFLYVFTIRFFFMPFNIYLFASIFIAPYFTAKFLGSKNLLFTKQILVTTILLVCSLFVCFISIVYNSTSDLTLTKSFITWFFVPFAAYVFAFLVKKINGQLTFKSLADYYIIVADIQIVISIVFFFSPGIADASLSILYLPEQTVDTLELLTGRRLFGFGVQFATAGTIFAFILVLISTVIKCTILSFKQIVFYSFSFLCIFLIGMMMSRTTVLGVILSFIIFFGKKRVLRSKKIRNKISLCIMIIFLIISIIIPWIISKIPTQIEQLIGFGFRLLTNQKEFQKNINLYTSIQKFPDSLKTWIIGDGLFIESNNSSKNLSYYMGTDAGYSRLIFYFGLLGTIIFFMFNIYLINGAKKNNDKKYNIFFDLIIVLLLITNMKMVQSYLILIYPFIFIKTLLHKNGDSGVYENR